MPGPRAPCAPAELALEPGALCVGDGAVRYRDVLRGRVAPRCRPTTTSAMCRARASTRSSRATSARPSWSSRSTSALPDADEAARVNVELRKLELRDLGAIERSSASRTRRRGRARCSPASSPSRARSASAPSSRRQARWSATCHLALRRRLARDEPRRRRPTYAATASHARSSTASSRSPRPTAPRLHARGPGLERRTRSGSTSASASSRGASGAATTPTTARTR